VHMSRERGAGSAELSGQSAAVACEKWRVASHSGEDSAQTKVMSFFSLAQSCFRSL
jgi:hypothetical protein